MEKVEIGTIEDLTPEILRYLYLDELLTETQIAVRFGTRQRRINTLRKKWNIPTLGKTGRLARLLPPLTELQTNLLTGSLLGDGQMTASSSASARFMEQHSLGQEEYLDWKISILGDYVSSTFPVRKEKDGKVYLGKKFCTKSCPQLRPFYDAFYPAPDRKRRFPSDLYVRINPFVLAVWYLDDGSLLENHPRISYGLDEVSLKRACRALRTLGLKPDIYGEGSDIGIQFRGQADVFFNLVSLHVPEHMRYKLQPEKSRIKIDRNAKRLTPERAQELSSGGMSIREIADLYGVGTSTVHRRLKGNVPKPGRRKRQYSRQAAEISLANYNPKEWPSLSDDEKNHWVSEIVKVITRSPFPSPEVLSQEQLDRELKRLRAKEIKLEGDTLAPWSHTGSRICLGHFPDRYKATSRRRISAFEAWRIQKHVEYAVRFQLNHGDPVLPHRVLRALTMQFRTPSIFRPTVAKWVYSTYCKPGDSVWDPCSGYGGRLLGAHVAGVRYIASEADEATVRGNVALGESLGADFKISNCTAEEFSPPSVDLVFTSPPYFDQEQYSTDDKQSYRRYLTFDSWCEGFVRPLVRKARSSLLGTGHLVLNVSDVRQGRKTIPVVQAVTDVALGEGFSLKGSLWMPLARINRSKESAREPILVFRPS